ncbi:MAG: hypothetical protein MZV64_19540 [Ignavibacteriales bacterium]|nr:hypothetical protein [Ignavibacteriales bacterium]
MSRLSPQALDLREIAGGCDRGCAAPFAGGEQTDGAFTGRPAKTAAGVRRRGTCASDPRQPGRQCLSLHPGKRHDHGSYPSVERQRPGPGGCGG